MLRVSNLDVFYGSIQALWTVSLEVKQGQIVSLIGSNGAGKTTLLKAIAGSAAFMRGSIEFFGRKINGMSPHSIVSSGIVYVPEGRRVFPYMTVLENLELGAYHREARKTKEDNLSWVLTIFPGLKIRLNQMAGTLSGGEQQMLAVGRGLMSRPKFLLLDEPSQGLAPILVDTVFQVIKRINGEGVTILLVEQNARRALEIAQRAYVMETGKIVLEGEGTELLQNEDLRRAYLGIGASKI